MDVSIEKRVLAGRAAIWGQVGFLHRNLGKVESLWKEDATRVTEVDLEVAKQIFQLLESIFPEDDYFSEEMDPGQGVLARKGEFSWILDPIDGTNNYALGIPFCSISLALLRDGKPVYGLIYDAGRRKMMEGGKGYPLLDGDETISANQPTTTKFVAVHSVRSLEERDHLSSIVANYKVRAMGSSALHLAYVANNLFAGMVDINIKIWDIAAAVALCEAVGKEVRFLNKPAFPLDEFDIGMSPLHVCAGNPEMCGHLTELLSQSSSLGKADRDTPELL